MILAFFPLQLLHEDMNNINALFIYGGWTERSQKVMLVPVASAEPRGRMEVEEGMRSFLHPCLLSDLDLATASPPFPETATLQSSLGHGNFNQQKRKNLMHFSRAFRLTAVCITVESKLGSH